MTAATVRVVLPCDDCGQVPVERSSNSAYAYCKGCHRRHKEAAAKNAGHLTYEAELALTVSTQRLRIEATRACLRLAILRDDWRLVDIGLDELEGIDRVADFRKVCGL